MLKVDVILRVFWFRPVNIDCFYIAIFLRSSMYRYTLLVLHIGNIGMFVCFLHEKTFASYMNSKESVWNIKYKRGCKVPSL